MSRTIEDCIPELQTAWAKLQELFYADFPDHKIFLTCAHRTPEEQFELFQSGRQLFNGEWVVICRPLTRTNCDGTKKLSNHNYYPSRAFDVAILDEKKRTVWDTGYKAWQKMPEYAKKLGIVNGGTWEKLKDFPHFETC